MEHIQSAVRLNATSRMLGILFGPAVGAGLMFWLGPSFGLLANAIIYLPLTLWLLVVPYTGHLREGAAPKRAIGRKDVINVIREVAHNRPIITMVILGGSASLFVGNSFQTQMPGFAHDLGAEKADFAYGALLTASAAGAVFGGFVLEGKGWLKANVKTAITCAILWCGVVAAFALSTSYFLSITLLFIAGVLNLSFYSAAQAIVQLEAPIHLRGRLIGFDVRLWFARVQWCDSGLCRRADRHSLVVGDQRDGAHGSDAGTPGVRVCYPQYRRPWMRSFPAVESRSR
jgi:hypothetical protein